MQAIDKNWLMTQVELLTKNPKSANIGINRSRCDLEIIIKVDPEDRSAFTDEVLTVLKNEISARTGFGSPVIYLEGNEPEWLAKGAYI